MKRSFQAPSWICWTDPNSCTIADDSISAEFELTSSLCSYEWGGVEIIPSSDFESEHCSFDRLPLDSSAECAISCISFRPWLARLKDTIISRFFKLLKLVKTKFCIKVLLAILASAYRHRNEVCSNKSHLSNCYVFQHSIKPSVLLFGLPDTSEQMVSNYVFSDFFIRCPNWLARAIFNILLSQKEEHSVAISFSTYQNSKRVAILINTN